MIIEIDCNNDTLRVEGLVWSVKNLGPNQLLFILQEIFTRLDDINDNSIQVELIKIDEDRRTTVGEW